MNPAVAVLLAGDGEGKLRTILKTGVASLPLS